MRKQKTLQELTIKDDFMFGAVMQEEENCKAFLEMVLGFSIAEVAVNKEKNIVYHPEYKGIRLDIYAQDEHRTHYNVEMQARKQEAVGKRSRYYHSQIVMEELGKGKPYQELPKTFVIFVCDYDPFGEGLFCYTFRNICREAPSLEMKDGGCTIFLSTRGKNEAEVSLELVRFLRYVRADLAESEEDFEDELVKKLQRTIRRIKADREIGERYMTLEELLREREQEGMEIGIEKGIAKGSLSAKRESVLELLEELGEVPEELQARIGQLTDLKVLSALHKLAARAESICAFEEASKAYFS